jgi:hypothetical protein
MYSLPKKLMGIELFEIKHKLRIFHAFFLDLITELTMGIST